MSGPFRRPAQPAEAIARRRRLCRESQGQALKRHLVTTAIETTWESDRPIVFLGSWCTMDSRHHQWSRLNYELAPYHWDDIEAQD